MDTTTLFAKIDLFFAAAQTNMVDRLYASPTKTLFRTSSHHGGRYAESMARA